MILPPVLNPKHNYVTLERETREDGVRHYVDPSGARLASVTTILDATGDKTFLIEWKARVGEKKANEIRDEAAGLGSLMHEHMECFLEGRERPKGNNLVRQMARRMADKIITEAMPQVDEVWGIESCLYYPKLYAGTTDLVGVYNGKPAIMDFKNARKMRTKDMIVNYMAQLGAYALAHDELFGTKIETGVIFMCARDLQYKTFVIEGAEFEEHKVRFLNRLDTYLTSHDEGMAAQSLSG